MNHFIYLSAFVASLISISCLFIISKDIKEENDWCTADIFQEVVKAYPGESFVMSAFSVLSPLAQLMLASTDESYYEIKKLIRMADRNNYIEKEFPKLNKQLKTLKGVQFKLANKFYVRQGIPLNEEFAIMSKKVFNTGEAQSIDFSNDSEATDEINAWVENNTNHLIKNVLPPQLLDAKTVAVLVSSIYFKGDWLNKFEGSLTQPSDFHVNKEQTIMVPMMLQTNKFKYTESKELDAKLLEMKYQGGQASLLLILPNQIDGIDNLVKLIRNPLTISGAMEYILFKEVIVKIPSFTIETTINLKTILNNLGVNKLFTSGKAELYNMVEKQSDLYLSEAIQKVHFDVNENGSQAAAASVVTVGGGTENSTQVSRHRKYFIADHPFYFALRIGGMVVCNVSTFVASVISRSNQDILKAGNDWFTANMLQEVVKANPGKNVVLSAFSALSPLAQLSLAATGESRHEILNAIGLPDHSVIVEQFMNLTNHFSVVRGVELNLANKVYVSENIPLNKQFAMISREVFNSEAENIDFSNNYEAAHKINTWVEYNTNHRIKNLIAPQILDARTVAVLVSAIYFKGDWLHKFEGFMTQPADFHVNKQQTITMPMMQQTNNFKYGESKELDAKLLEMKYQGGQSSLLLILPNEIDGIKGLVEKLRNPLTVSRAVRNMRLKEVFVMIPSFKVETSIELKPILNNMNVKKIFLPGQAKLYNMVEKYSDLYLSEAVQKCYIDVNENGSEAAAATAYIIAYSLGADTQVNPNRKYFIADHPFYFALQIGDIVAFNGIITK